jgi:streptogramin lyase
MIPTMRIAIDHRLVVGSCVSLALAVIVASCGHGGSSVAPGTGQTHGPLQSVKFHITVPTPAPGIIPEAFSRRATVKPQYVSSGTTEATVTVTPQNGVPYPAEEFSCTSSSCTGNVDAPVGSDTFLVSLYGGDRISPDTLLSTGTTVATIAAGVTNEVDVTFDPVVSSIVLSANPSSLPPGVEGNSTITVDATDASGGTIIGPGTYVNSSGAALTIDLSTVDKLLNGNIVHDTTLSSNTLSGPPASGPTQVTLTYNGDAKLANITVNASTTVAINGTISPVKIQVAASPSPTPTGCSISATPQPAATFFKVPSNGPESLVGDSIAAGPDGNLWTSDGSRNVLLLQTNGKMTEIAIPGAGAGSVVTSMNPGPAGGTTVWFADFGTRSVGRISTGTTPSISVFPVPDIENGNESQPLGIAAGPDGNMWFTDRGSDYVGNISPLLATIDEYEIPTNSSRVAQDDVVLPNGMMFFVETGTGKIAYVQISSLVLGSLNAITERTPKSAKPGDLRYITSSPDGNVWFTENLSDKIGRVNVSANPITVDEFSLATKGAQPEGIAMGPDGAIWFAEFHSKMIGRIALNAAPGTTPQEFSFGFLAPAGVTTGSDCNLWVTDQTAPRGRVGKITF